MPKSFENLNNTFNISSEVVKSEKAIEPIIVDNKQDSNDIKKDYEYTRGNLYSLIEKGQEAINGILELAQDTEMPRAYEVAAQLIKNVGDVTDKLMALQVKLKEVEEESTHKSSNVTNALFVGSTADLAKFLKQKTPDSPKSK